MLERARALGITILCGTDSGNSPLMPYGQLHAHEPEILIAADLEAELTDVEIQSLVLVGNENVRNVDGV